MSKDFDLATILSAISGINFTDDFEQVFDLYKFAYGDGMNMVGMAAMLGHLKAHVLGMYPELGFVQYEGITNIDAWLIEQKARFGERLNLVPAGQQYAFSENNRLV